jgi:hypothetical protein
MARALREESAKNISTAMAMTGDTEWLKVSTPDLRNVMNELQRLQRIEAALLSTLDSKIAQADVARAAAKKAEQEWEIEEKINRLNEERKLKEEAFELSMISEGKEWLR